ncbi:MAG: tetratricopeptide repeat protein [Mariprofundus sp.]
MNQKTTDKKVAVVEPAATSTEEMQELKREMRSAEWNAWLLQNKQSLMVGVVLLIAGLIAGGMWIEHNRSQQNTAASLYQQAVNAADPVSKKALLENLYSEFGSGSYGGMAQMQLMTVDAEHADAHLQALTDDAGAMDEWKWQARLDLAQRKIEQGDADGANALLKHPVGKQYQQLRYYLLATIAKDAAEKKQQLQKALDAAAPDEKLKQKIENQLSLLAS